MKNRKKWTIFGVLFIMGVAITGCGVENKTEGEPAVSTLESVKIETEVVEKTAENVNEEDITKKKEDKVENLETFPTSNVTTSQSNGTTILGSRDSNGVNDNGDIAETAIGESQIYSNEGKVSENFGTNGENQNNQGTGVNMVENVSGEDNTEQNENISVNAETLPANNGAITPNFGDINGINNGNIAVTDNNEGQVYRNDGNVLENFSTNGENLNNQGVVNENFSDKN